ncbi:MAG: PadR family transcriptional regulator [Rectinemataceae bacterium]|jgi:DNA-binding PadR family transcriptional regulator
MTESYKVPFYILGFLIRLGPLHGYQLKAHIELEARDFAKIRLPNLYYHLGSMREKGWVESKREKEGSRPEKDIFSITDEGRSKFGELLERALAEPVDWDFPLDGALFFSKGRSAKRIERELAAAEARATAALESLAAHRKEVLAEVPQGFRDVAGLILSHHERHYATEREWLAEAKKVFEARKGKIGGDR